MAVEVSCEEFPSSVGPVQVNQWFPQLLWLLSTGREGSVAWAQCLKRPSLCWCISDTSVMDNHCGCKRAHRMHMAPLLPQLKCSVMAYYCMSEYTAVGWQRPGTPDTVIATRCTPVMFHNRRPKCMCSLLAWIDCEASFVACAQIEWAAKIKQGAKQTYVCGQVQQSRNQSNVHKCILTPTRYTSVTTCC